MSHRWLIAVSMGAHLSVAGGLFVGSLWRIDRMEDHNRSHAEILRPAPPPAPAGELVGVKLPDIKPKDKTPPVVKTTVQPTTRTTSPDKPAEPGGGDNPFPGNGPGDPDAAGTCTENCGEAPRTAPVCGDHSLDAGEQCDDGNTINGDGCSSTCRIEVKPKPIPVLAPSVLQGLRLSGETQVHPSSATQTMMIHDGVSKAVGTVKLCISADGSVASASTMGTTKYADYDAALVSAVRGWHYRPYLLNGAPVPACSMVSFVYTIR